MPVFPGVDDVSINISSTQQLSKSKFSQSPIRWIMDDTQTEVKEVS